MGNAEQEVRVFSDEVYSHAGGVPRLADVYLPTSRAGPPPVVIWIHGGGWRFGDRKLAPNLRLFAERSGFAVVSIDYRLSDEVKFPTPVVDVKAAVRWVRSVASRFEFDDGHVGLWGSSAGAHLAACAALSSEDDFLSSEHSEFSSAVQAVVDGYGPTNLARIDEDRSSLRTVTSDAESALVGGHVLPAADPDSFESRFIGMSVKEAPRQVQLADPAHYVHSGSPPFLILHGEADSLIPCNQSQILFDALRTTDNDATLVLFEKLGHGFFNNCDLAKTDYGKVTVFRSQTDRSLRSRWSCDGSADIPTMVIDFLQAHLRNP